MKKCLVCNSKDLSVERYFTDHILLEEYITCRRCSFHYEFIHGNSRYYFGRYEFCFFWNESKTRFKKKNVIMNLRMSKHRKIVKHLYKIK